MDADCGGGRKHLRIPSLWPYLILCALAAVWIDLGRLHSGYCADSLIPVLVSLQRWTPFFWEQDRIGMLVPLLAAPFKHPLVNLLVQAFFYIFSYLAATFLLARYMLRNASYPLVAALSAAAFVSLAPIGYRRALFLETFYGVWLALGLGALLLLEPSPSSHISWQRRVFALICMILAHWVYIPTALVFGPLVVCRHFFFASRSGRRRMSIRVDAGNGPEAPKRRQAMRLLARCGSALSSPLGLQLLVLTIGSLAGFLLMRLGSVSLTAYYTKSLPPKQWWPTCWRLLHGTWQVGVGTSWPLILAGGAGVGLLLLGIPAVRRQSGPSLRAAGALAVAAVTWWLFLGTRGWVVLNEYAHRYTEPAVFLLQAAFIIVAAGPLATLLVSWERRRTESVSWNRIVAGALIPAALTLAVIAGYGLPSVAGVRATLDRELGRCTADILDSRCEFIAGDYWKVWPAVFHANLTLYERKERRTVWGVTYRSTPTKRLWPSVPLQDLRVAIPVGGELRATEYLNSFQFPSLVVEKRPTVLILRPQAIVREEGDAAYAANPSP